MLFKNIPLLVFTTLLPLSLYAHKQTDTQRELAHLKKQNAVLLSKVDKLCARVDALTGTKAQPCNEQKSPNYANNIKNNYPYFYEIVTQNSPKSNANNNLCIKGMLCFSGLANFDLNMSDHFGDIFANNGSMYGVGVRPMFGANEIDFFGSITDINLFIDAAVNNWVMMHLDFAYVSAAIETRSFSHDDTDWGTAYRPAASLRVNQGYILFANPAVIPFYIQIGRFNTTFGDYEPFPMTRTLPQLLEEQRSGGVNVGIISQCGLYASAEWTMSQQSLDNFTADRDEYYGTNRDRNYGGKLGFKGPVSNGVRLDLDVSYTADMRDSDYLLSGYEFYNRDLHNIPIGEAVLLHNAYVRMIRTPGFAAHAAIEFSNFEIYGNYVTALNSLNENNIENSKVWAMDVAGNVKFPVCGCPVKIEAGYQRAQNADVFMLIEAPFPVPPEGFIPAPGLPLVMGNVLPEHRLVGSVWVKVLPNITLAAQYVHDTDFGFEDGGSGKDSNFAVFRINVEV